MLDKQLVTQYCVSKPTTAITAKIIAIQTKYCLAVFSSRIAIGNNTRIIFVEPLTEILRHHRQLYFLGPLRVLRQGWRQLEAPSDHPPHELYFLCPPANQSPLCAGSNALRMHHCSTRAS